MSTSLIGTIEQNRNIYLSPIWTTENTALQNLKQEIHKIHSGPFQIKKIVKYN